MQTSRGLRIIVVAGILSLFISYVGIWFRFIQDPVERTGSDFIAFYAAGRVAQKEGPAHVYDPVLIQQIQEQEVGFPLAPGQVLLYNHLPFLIPILQTIVSPNYVNSFYRWIALLSMLYMAGIIILSRTLTQAGIDRSSTLLTAIGSALFLPVFFSLMNGQDTAFILLGVALWMYGMNYGKETVAGLGLSLTTVRPHIALLLAVPMLFRYRKVFVGFLLGSAALALSSVLILGAEGTKTFIDILLLSASGEWYGMKENAMYNLIGMLTRIAPQLEAGMIHIIGWMVYGIALIALCIIWFKTRDSQNGLIGASVIVALFVVPHLHFHDLALLLIPIYELIRKSREAGTISSSFAATTPIMLSLLFLVSNISPYLQYTTPYLIMLALALYPYYSKFGTPVIALHRS